MYIPGPVPGPVPVLRSYTVTYVYTHKRIIMLYSRLGLQQKLMETAPDGGKRVRVTPQSEPKRDDGLWQYVTVLRQHATSPQVQCTFCQHVFVGGATRIRDHICDKCTCGTNAFMQVKEKLLTERADSAAKKAKKTVERDVDEAVESAESCESKVKTDPEVKIKGQQTIRASMQASSSAEIDDVIAEFFYGCNVEPAIADNPLFKKMVMKLKTAPASYKPPDRNRLSNDLLESTTARLKREEAPLRETVLKDGGTVVSDGWDDVAKNHLINFLCGNSKGFFFDGTLKLTSEDSENAEKVAKLICDEITSVGALSIVQVVTDTCAVMQAAWKLIEKKFPWITCTCCAPHVLSLELKDMAKISDPAAVIEGAQKILARFWGRKRWARTKLREVAKRNLGKDVGLYRAKVTRFAGKVRELARILRLKSFLQEVVVSAEYSQQKWSKDEAEADDQADDEADATADGEDIVKKLILDEAGFWKKLVEVLRIMTPIVKLLRLTDGEQPAMGKVYDRMFMIGQKIDESSAIWKAEAAAVHEKRWEYLHSFMHAAGYALDPEFMDTQGDIDEATQNGLFDIIEKMSIRDAIAESDDSKRVLASLYAADDLHTAVLPADIKEKALQRATETHLELAKYQQRAGTFASAIVQNAAKQMPPAAWWAMYGKHVPRLAAVARRVLAQPVSASAAERNWSVYGRIVTPTRSRTRHARADKLVYCHEALHLRAKLLRAGYVQQHVKWDSDSDSDETDEEDLMM